MGQWRNAMQINPLEKYGGMSYFDVVLKPLADAMAAALQENTYVSGCFHLYWGGGGCFLELRQHVQEAAEPI